MKKILFVLVALFLTAFKVYAEDGFVYTLKYSGAIAPSIAEFIENAIKKSEKDKANALVILLDTPGGLDTSMRDISKAIINSKIPVIAYVSPSGARAASAGVIITISAHIAAMSPGTNIGAAHPVNMGGEKMDEVMSKKVENDAAAYLESIAKVRGKNSEWAIKAVRESASITADDALKNNVIDFVATDLTDLLSKTDGKIVETANGKITMKTKNVTVKEIEMGFKYRILSVISDPNIAYILFLLGIYGLIYELASPGAILPGVVGAISMILGLYAMSALSVNYAGLLLIVLGIILLVAEIKVISGGLLGMGGVISFFVGSLMLFDVEGGNLRVSLSIIIPSVGLTALYFLAVVAKALKAQRTKIRTGAEALVGRIVELDGHFEHIGKVFIDGEYWNAFSEDKFKKGEEAVISKVEGLKLFLEKKKFG